MLKQLKLRAELKQRQAELDKLNQQKADFDKRNADLAASLEEAQTDEDINLVNQNIEALEKEVGEAGIEDKIKSISSEITRIENEIKELDEKSDPKQSKQNIKNEERELSMNRLQLRELLKTGEYYERAEVKEFYEKFKNLRAVTGEGLTIPNLALQKILCKLVFFRNENLE
jgi:Tfp pilus assembly protein FimV